MVEAGFHASAAVRMVLEDPATSFRLKAVVRDWARRDPVDAARDARILCSLFEALADQQLGRTSWPSG